MFTVYATQSCNNEEQQHNIIIFNLNFVHDKDNNNNNDHDDDYNDNIELRDMK